MPRSIQDKRTAFRKLHESGCFVLPNPWDVGGARLLQQMGYRAIASTSSGHAWSTGRPDNGVGVDDVLAHLTALCAAVDLPVNADFEAGFAHDAEGVAANVVRAVATGVAGLSIEDSTGDIANPLYDEPLAIERMRAAKAAISDSGVLLVGRCEGFLVGKPDLGFVIDRLVKYAEAGADCLYAPGLKSADQIAEVVKAVAPKPVNVLVGAPGFAVQQLADLGVRRISVGGALARVAWGGFLRAAREMLEQGTFKEMASGAPFAELNGFFGSPAP